MKNKFANKESLLKNKAFYDLIEIIKNRVDCGQIDTFIEKYTLEEIIFAFRANGIGVNAYPGSNSFDK